MGKYLAVMSNNIKSNLVYRTNSYIMMFAVLFSFGVLFYFWSSIYRQGNTVGTYSFNQIISYYVYIMLFEILIMNYGAWSTGEAIKSGQIIINIVKPIKYLEYKFSQAIGELIYKAMLFVPVIVVVLFFLKNFLFYPNDKRAYLIFIILSLLSFILNFLIYFIIGILAFWLEDYQGFYWAWLVIVTFMQGQWIPLDLLPKWFAIISAYLPFKYLFFIPVSFISGRIPFEYSMFFVPVLWCVACYLLAKFIYKKGLIKYEAYGS